MSGWPATGLLLFAFLCLGAGRLQDAPSDREIYNQGTAKLNEGELAAAEGLLFEAVIANGDPVQPAALYNLGLARFAQGVEELEAGPDTSAVSQRAVSASANADNAIHEGLTAMEQAERNDLLRAYFRGRGARRQLKDAMEALQEALDVYGSVLSRWQRASGDFHSAAELNPNDEDAAHNADVVDRHIAELIDSIRQMEAMIEGMGEQMQGLGEMLEELEGMLPGEMDNPGAGEDGDDWPGDMKPGGEEPRGRDGEEMPISPEDAKRLLEAFQLDRDRTLPMGFEETAEPEDKEKGRNW